MRDIEGSNRNSRPLERWKDRVKEYTSERGTGRGGGLEQAKRECLYREKWRLFAMAILLGVAPRGSEVSEIINRLVERKSGIDFCHRNACSAIEFTKLT